MLCQVSAVSLCILVQELTVVAGLIMYSPSVAFLSLSPTLLPICFRDLPTKLLALELSFQGLLLGKHKTVQVKACSPLTSDQTFSKHAQISFTTQFHSSTLGLQLHLLWKTRSGQKSQPGQAASALVRLQGIHEVEGSRTSKLDP